ncbi:MULTISPECIES: alpha/beta hydrolase [unclassified Streptomyces]|uniref:alpha/beta hydrolase n=1 Tax=unclassified Streptomyces TaxID=2593676 RepID=UPI0022580670|nr:MULTISPECIES: alpha/beta hydrolase [unclassified Streptomyces]MCX4641966.1 alpha/beta hydrolase [Streptomyces sp. NBC_01446]MCX5085701.1 alpha/beta hydrolase [Streptomyces sp. NBC_00401]MCX5326840.1 alpha/beta hydrolase [Streptomyces sp. NBC_00120]
MNSETSPPQTSGLTEVLANNSAVMGRFMEGLSKAPLPPERIDPPAVRVVRDIVFSTPTGTGGPTELRMDLYLPRSAPAPAPVIVWLPGGGWRGQRRGYGPRLPRLFAERGYAMVDVDYRSSDVDRWPAQIDDVLAALHHLHGLADVYDLDTGALGLWGSSAGAHLALLAAFATDGAGARTVPGVRAVVAGYPPTDLLRLNEDALPGGVQGVDLSDPAWGLLGGNPWARSAEAVQASPVRQVHPQVPPVLLLHGDRDLLIGPAQSRRLHDALLTAGAESHLLMVRGADHSFLNSADWERRPMTATVHSSHAPGLKHSVPLTPALIERFFDRHLRTDPWNA